MSTWTESFTNGIGSRLQPYSGPDFTSALADYATTPDVVRVVDGKLRLTAIKQPSGRWKSALLTTRNRLTFQYGKVEARIKLPSARGAFPAFWLMAADGHEWPKCGEIDVVAAVTDATVAYSTAHSIFDIRYGGQLRGVTKIAAESWHTYGVDWKPDSLTFLVDGVAVGSINKSEYPNEWRFDPAYIVLNLAVGGNWPGPPDATTPNSFSMYVDWLKVTW